jgi:exosortase
MDCFGFRASVLASVKARNLLSRGYAIAEMKALLVRAHLIDSPDSELFAWRFAATAFFFALLWLEVINQLKAEWSFNPQYGYGWSVPFLALYLLWRRWPTWPAPAPGNLVAATRLSGRLLPTAAAITCALLFLPLRFVAEANPDWRLISWAMALAAIALTLSCIFLMGGLHWLRHFAFPVVFFLVAVPWPVHFEQVVVQNLMRAVTGINVALLNTVGIPAFQLGNVIEVGTGLIGIEEACSGVRSMQATLMVSLFLGELYSFNVLARVILVLTGGALAFFCNLVRTAILVWVGAHKGIKAIEAWHDPAGLTILLFCLFGLWALSLILQRRSVFQPPQLQRAETSAAPINYSHPLLVGLALWLILAEATVQTWYRLHRSPAEMQWTVNWPTSEVEYKSMPVPTEVENLLRYNEGGSGAWHGRDGRPWMMYFFRWFPGRTAALFVKIHRPDVCLPASGMILNRDAGIRLLPVNGVNLPIRSYRFDDRGRPLHVFYCYADGRSSYENAKAAEQEDWTMRGRMRAAWQGRRDVGAQMLEVIVWGYENDREADEALQRALARIIQLG